MYRTTTTAALLVTVAVSALSGCVTVRQPATPGPPDTAPSQPTAPRPDGSAPPRVVQAPVVEALEMAGPSRHPERSGPPAGHRPPATPEVTRRPPAPPAPPAPRPVRPRSPGAEAPVPAPPLPGAPDVCALGNAFGGWRADGPEASICEQAYGH
ncbi:hypothetical protein [Streptomyces naphthomycinicus]|uniref:hypothetical protein n=1 Tax=Streptomyces naphthomycinicus TaxID=2872625 RepID=UPI001CEDCB62|nr:hypothetical protein [Streptomyces sp. TML10]